MPILYEYLGIVVYFYSNEHIPIHVHGKYQEFESKAELIFVNGQLTEINLKNVVGRKPLKNPQKSEFLLLVESKANEIVEKWNDCFVYNKKISKIKINKKLLKNKEL